MQILESKPGWQGTRPVSRTFFAWSMFLLLFGLAAAGCKKDVSMEAIETDAHGYLCLGCGAKWFTDRKHPLESKCPKCQQQTLEDVVGHLCQKDQHLTIRPRTGPQSQAVCEQCGAHLKNAMMLPRQKDLMAWGATKAP